ncbi:hypothetical protein [Flavobacterium lindanitolerans]|uniref:hypothetical protein n=1 Tax=Flavobacterium lindanitolerans TaxID=428988 RepID=UPI0031A74698
MEWRNVAPEIPAFKFPADWEVKIIPLGNLDYLPTLKDAVTRATTQFLVRVENEVWISVILDLEEVFGSYGGQPYWEVEEIGGGDESRFDLNDTDGVIQAIQEAKENYFKAKSN